MVLSFTYAFALSLWPTTHDNSMELPSPFIGVATKNEKELISPQNSPTLEPLTQNTDQELEILFKADGIVGLPGQAMERNLIQDFAGEQGLSLIWISYDDQDELLRFMSGDRGDVILSGDRSLQAALPEEVLFTVPWGISRQQVVVRSDTGYMNGIADLTTRQIAVKKSSGAWPILRDLADSYKAMALIVIPENHNADSILQRISSGEFDLAVMDSLLLDDILYRFLDLEVAFDLTDKTYKNWGVRPAQKGLHASLNQFLNKKHLASGLEKAYQEDLYDLKSRKRLRLITYQDATNYFMEKGRLQGFEYELLNRFAKDNKMRLDVVIAQSHEEMKNLLLQGKGDVIAASLPIGSLGEDPAIQYTRFYNFAAPVIIGREYDYPLLDERDLVDRSIVLHPQSPYRQVLERLQDRGLDFEIILADANANVQDTLFKISEGHYDLGIIGSHQINSDFKKQINLKVHFTLDEPFPHAWVVRQKDTQLLSSMNRFIDKEYRKAFYNVLSAKYIEAPVIRRLDSSRFAQVKRLSPYDDIVYDYAEQYGFDWRLLVAQMYMESRFNPKAVSVAGAEGLMQLMPETAEHYGISDLNDPDLSIYAGVRYMDYLRNRFEEGFSPEDRIWFSLAAYNAGYNRIKRGRILAGRMGLDPDRWFNHVERAMLVLSRPKILKNGEISRYCRCGQTVYYVREIKTLYSNYVRLTQAGRMTAQEVSQNNGS